MNIENQSLLYKIYFKQWTWHWWYEVVKKNNFSCYELSENVNITLDIVKENLDKKWNYDILMMNKSFTWEDINYIKSLTLTTYEIIIDTYISFNPNITLDIVFDNPQFNWEYNFIIQNKNIKLDDIKKYLPKLEKKNNFLIDFLSLNENVTWEYVVQNPQIKWSYDFLTSNKNITLNIIKANPDKNWNFNYLSRNLSITWNDIVSNPEINWDWDFISSHPNITWEIIKSNLNNPWCWHCVCHNPNITFEIILQSPLLKPHLFNFLENENISIKIFNQLFKENTNKKQRRLINNFSSEKDKYINEKITQYFKLKEELIANIWHPKNFDKFKYLDPDTFDFN
jgi:hypothetical protein